MTTTALVYRMVINILASKPEQNTVLYEAYIKECRLYVPIKEILETKNWEEKAKSKKQKNLKPKVKNQEIKKKKKIA